MGRTNKRLTVLWVVMLLVIILLFVQTFRVQVLAKPDIRARAESQSERKLSIPAPRGAIYDRKGEQLAVSQTMATITANPKHIKDANATAALLAPVLDIPQEELVDKLSRDSGFVYLARKVDLAKSTQIEELRTKLRAEKEAWKLDGIDIESEDKRLYPAGALAPQILGFVGQENTGLAGIEKQYDNLLLGTPGLKTVVASGANRLNTVSVQEAIPGQPITMTIDSDIQFEAERVLVETVENYKAKKACAIVMDPSTGEIIAMANTPAFPVNQYGEMEESATRNSAVVDMYEPGSTFKMITVAAALQEGLVTPDTRFELRPTIKVHDKVIHEAHFENLGVRNLSVREILAKSSNVGAITLGMKLGKERLANMIKAFGFTEKLDIDFPGEAAGLMPEIENWSGTTIANVPMGQGISVTPLQLTSAYAAIANKGVLIQPHLVRGQVTPWTRQVVSAEVAAQLLDMLHSVTDDGGTGTKARIEGYEVAGKTGTAQKVIENGGGYYSNRYVSSFVGMVPASAPRLVILVVVDDPTTEYYGSSVAAPAFAQIADFALKSLGIPPTPTSVD